MLTHHTGRGRGRPATAARATRTTLAAGLAAALAVTTLAATLTTTLTTTAQAATTTTTSPAKAAAGWLARQLVGPRHDHYAVSFGGSSFPDPGLTADGLLSMDAAHVSQAAAARMTKWLAAKATSYATGGGRGYYPGALAKLLLVAEAQHANVHDFGGVDLVRRLRHDEQPSGVYANVADPSFGSSPIQQALALIALSHTGSIGDWPNAKAIAWLVGQQCGDGGFVSSTSSTPAATCTDVDATGYAAQALLTVHSSAAARAIRWLHRHVNKDGGFGLDQSGNATSNANSTALAVQALLQAGGKALTPLAWLRHHQVGCSGRPARRGAVRFAGGFSAATALRATSQAGQALGRAWLGHMTNRGAAAAAPVLQCG